MPRFLLVLVALNSAAPRAWACPVGNIDLAEHLSTAEQAFTQMEAADFERAMQQLDTDLRCLNEVASAQNAARVHQVYGLAAFYRGERALALQEFALSQRGPWTQLSASLAPPGGDLAKLYAEARLASGGSTTGLRGLDGERLWLDGVRSDGGEAPVPVIVQRQAADGELLESLYLLPGEEPPLWAKAQPSNTRGSQALSRRLGVGALLFGIGSGVAFGSAAYRYQTLLNLPYEFTQLDGQVTQSEWEARHTLYRRSAVGVFGAAGASLALGIGAALAAPR